MRIGVVAALDAELRTAGGFSRRAGSIADLPHGMLGVVSGIGAARARAAAVRLVQAGANALVSWGCAGALSREINTGALVLPQEVLDRHGTRFTVDREWHHQLCEHVQVRVHTGALAETSTVLADSAAKTALAQRTGACAADMESAAIAEVAAEKHFPFVAVRAISDAAYTAIPLPLLRCMSDDGEISLARAIPALIFSPASLGAAARLGFGFRAALTTLRRSSPHLFATRYMGTDPLQCAT